MVSRVINNKGYVSAEKRERVKQAVRELGYRPNLVARGLKTNQTRQLLFYAPELTNPFYVDVYQGMEDYAEKHGYTIVVSRHYDDDMIYQRRFDGIILSAISKKQQDDYLKLGIPVVVTNYTGEALKIPSIGIDMKEGAIKAIDYLCECGHNRIGFITSVDTRQEQRFCGYVEGLQKNGLTFNPDWVILNQSGATAYEQGYRAGISLIEKKLGLTALFIFNDAMAIGTIAALSEKGIQIPKDISIIGFDDIVQSRYIWPPLTTIHIPKYEQGQESARMLIRKIKGETVKTVNLETKLVIRRSVKGI